MRQFSNSDPALLMQLSDLNGICKTFMASGRGFLSFDELEGWNWFTTHSTRVCQKQHVRQQLLSLHERVCLSFVLLS